MKRIVISVAAAFGVAVFVILLVLFVPRTPQFRKTFKTKCEAFQKTSQGCEAMLRTFEEAYVGKSPCSFSEQNYDRYLTENPFTHTSSKTMLWSETKGLVHDFSKGTGCSLTLEDTLVGSILDGLTWCGLKGNKQTFGVFCEIDSKNNPVISFWRNVSARFAAYASGVVTAMLNGGKNNPYDVNSVFALEVKSLDSSRVTQLNVVLLTDNQKKCDNESLQKLKEEVKNKGIGYSCKAVTRSRIEQCIKENISCGACW